MAKNYTAYIRVSDKNKQDHSTQKASIDKYAADNNLIIDEYVIENVSGSKTDLKDRKIAALIASKKNLIVTEVSRLGRTKVLGLIGIIGDIAEYGELHLSYTNQCINADNADNAEIIFTMVGQSFVAAQEASKRSQRAKAACDKRKANGLHNGRAKGAVVKSKLDDHVAFIINELEKKTPKTKILKKLEDEKGLKVSRKALYDWIGKRGL